MGLFSAQMGLFTNLTRLFQYPQIMCMSTCIYYVSYKYNDYNNVTIQRNLPTLSEIKTQLRTFHWSHKYNDYNNVTIRRNLPTLSEIKTQLRTFHWSHKYNDYNNVTIRRNLPTLSEIKTQLRTFHWSHKYNDYNNVHHPTKSPHSEIKTQLRTFYCSHKYNDYINVTIRRNLPTLSEIKSRLFTGHINIMLTITSPSEEISPLCQRSKAS